MIQPHLKVLFFLILQHALFLDFAWSQQVQVIEVKPSFQVSFRDPTQDKPQSKIWFSDGSWWTILPDSQGPSIWKRGDSQWQKMTSLDSELAKLPGKADVFSNGQEQYILLVGNCELNFLKLNTRSGSVQISQKGPLPLPSLCKEIETATITQDDAGTLWVASDMNEQVIVWSSKNEGISWSQPVVLSESISSDDISLISKFHGGVSVIWSNQSEDALYERTMLQKDHLWSPRKTISKGKKTADDHLNTTLLVDGRLALVSKNSLDQVGKPQFVFRVRSVAGDWEDFPYENLTEAISPTRPIITQLPNGQLIELHTNGLKSGAAEISVNSIKSQLDSSFQLSGRFRLVTKDGAHLNSVSVAKNDFQGISKGPWIVIFSDRNGNVYEFDLYPFRSLFL